MPQVPLEQGQLESVDITDPAAGVGWEFLLPNNFRYKIDSIQFVFTADANAANRRLQISVSEVGGIQREICFSEIIAANAVDKHTLIAGNNLPVQTAPNLKYWAWPPDLIVKGNTLIEVAFSGIQVGDQFTDLNIGLRKWPIQTI